MFLSGLSNCSEARGHTAHRLHQWGPWSPTLSTICVGRCSPTSLHHVGRQAPPYSTPCGAVPTSPAAPCGFPCGIMSQGYSGLPAHLAPWIVSCCSTSPHPEAGSAAEVRGGRGSYCSWSKGQWPWVGARGLMLTPQGPHAACGPSVGEHLSSRSLKTWSEGDSTVSPTCSAFSPP